MDGAAASFINDGLVFLDDDVTFPLLDDDTLRTFLDAVKGEETEAKTLSTVVLAAAAAAIVAAMALLDLMLPFDVAGRRRSRKIS